MSADYHALDKIQLKRYYRQCEHVGSGIADISRGTPDDNENDGYGDDSDQNTSDQNTKNNVLTLNVASMPILEIVWRPSSALLVSH